MSVGGELDEAEYERLLALATEKLRERLGEHMGAVAGDVPAPMFAADALGTISVDVDRSQDILKTRTLKVRIRATGIHADALRRAGFFGDDECKCCGIPLAAGCLCYVMENGKRCCPVCEQTLCECAELLELAAEEQSSP